MDGARYPAYRPEALFGFDPGGWVWILTLFYQVMHPHSIILDFRTADQKVYNYYGGVELKNYIRNSAYKGVGVRAPERA